MRAQSKIQRNLGTTEVLICAYATASSPRNWFARNG